MSFPLDKYKFVSFAYYETQRLVNRQLSYILYGSSVFIWKQRMEPNEKIKGTLNTELISSPVRNG